MSSVELKPPHQGEGGGDDDHWKEPQVGGGGSTPLSEVLLVWASVLLLKYKYSVSIFSNDLILISYDKLPAIKYK